MNFNFPIFPSTSSGSRTKSRDNFKSNKGEIVTVLTIAVFAVVTVSSFVSSFFLSKTKQTSTTKASEVTSCPNPADNTKWYCAGECADQAVRDIFNGTYPPDGSDNWKNEKAANCNINSSQCQATKSCSVPSPTPACVVPDEMNVVGVCDPACCKYDNQCPSGQKCLNPNGYCQSGSSCAVVNPTTGQGQFIQKCQASGCRWLTCDQQEIDRGSCVTKPDGTQQPANNTGWCYSNIACGASPTVTPYRSPTSVIKCTKPGWCGQEGGCPTWKDLCVANYECQLNNEKCSYEASPTPGNTQINIETSSFLGEIDKGYYQFVGKVISGSGLIKEVGISINFNNLKNKIYSVPPDGGTFMVNFPTQSLPQGNYQFQSYAIDKDGKSYFGTAKGFNLTPSGPSNISVFVQDPRQINNNIIQLIGKITYDNNVTLKNIEFNTINSIVKPFPLSGNLFMVNFDCSGKGQKQFSYYLNVNYEIIGENGLKNIKSGTKSFTCNDSTQNGNKETDFTVTTNNAGGITKDSATLYGASSSTDLDDKGFIYINMGQDIIKGQNIINSLTNIDSLPNGVTSVSVNGSTQNFSSLINNLESNTPYFYRAYGKKNIGGTVKTKLGETVLFTTPPSGSIVATGQCTNLGVDPPEPNISCPKTYSETCDRIDKNSKITQGLRLVKVDCSSPSCKYSCKLPDDIIAEDGMGCMDATDNTCRFSGDCLEDSTCITDDSAGYTKVGVSVSTNLINCGKATVGAIGVIVTDNEVEKTYGEAFTPPINRNVARDYITEDLALFPKRDIVFNAFANINYNGEVYGPRAAKPQSISSLQLKNVALQIDFTCQ